MHIYQFFVHLVLTFYKFQNPSEQDCGNAEQNFGAGIWKLWARTPQQKTGKRGGRTSEESEGSDSWDSQNLWGQNWKYRFGNGKWAGGVEGVPESLRNEEIGVGGMEKRSKDSGIGGTAWESESGESEKDSEAYSSRQ